MIVNPKRILEFWFEELEPSDWFKKSEELDSKIKEEFLETFQEATKGNLNNWRENAKSSLALIILLDQFSRNMFRDKKEAFENDSLALEIAKESIEKKFDLELGEKKTFMYMPLMHSETIEDQKECIRLFSKATLENLEAYVNNLKFAIAHYEIIKKFNRFPHRNKILERESTKEEEEFLKQPNSSF